MILVVLANKLLFSVKKIHFKLSYKSKYEVNLFKINYTLFTFIDVCVIINI